MKKNILLTVFPLLIPLMLLSQAPHGKKSPRPRVVLGIVVENMRPDYIDRYWDKFGEEGFRKLWSGGTVCTGFRISQHIVNGATGTATLYTGEYPAVHGIVNETWYDRQKGSTMGCVTDGTATLVGAASSLPGASPQNLRASTLGDQLKLFTNGKARVFSVALNAAPAVFAAGFSGDGAFWFEPESGRMVTASGYYTALPAWVKAFNDRDLPQKYSSRNWVLLKSPGDYKESTEDKNPLETGYGPGLNYFPHSVGNLVKKSGSYAPLKTTPFGNSMVGEFAREMMGNEAVGKDDVTDLVSVVFSSMDDENNAFGPASVEMEDLYLRLDEEIAALLSYAEKQFGKENVLIFLTANSSASYPVPYLKETLKFPAGYFSPENAMALLNSYLNITFGDLKWVEYNNGLQIYLNHKIAEINNVDLSQLRSKTAVFLSQFEGVKRAVTADQVRNAYPEGETRDAIARTWFEGRSGDVLLELREGWQPAYKLKKANYSEHPRLPLVFYGAGIPSRIVPSPCEATSFAPTLADLLGIPSPGSGTKIIGF